MSLATTGSLASFSVTANTNQLDLSAELAEIIRPDNTVALNRFGISGFTASQTIHRWNEDSLNSNIATTNAALDNSATSIVMASGQGAKFKVGTLFKERAQGKTEVMQVTAVSTDTLTIVRGYGSTSAETHGGGSAFDVLIIAHAKQEDWGPSGEDWTKERVAVSNITQVFGRGITIGDTREKISNNAIGSEIAHQTAYRMKELSREMDATFINGIVSADAGSNTSYRSMGGMIEFVSASGGNVNTTAENFNEAVVNAMVKQIWDDGGQPNFIMMGGAKKQTFATFDQAYRRSDFSSKVAGFTVEQFITSLGFTLDVIVDPWVNDDVVIIGEVSKASMGPLQSDGVRLEELARTGRSRNYMITGQYTAEFRNALQAFAIHSNLN